jgi:hypothetical protein
VIRDAMKDEDRVAPARITDRPRAIARRVEKPSWDFERSFASAKTSWPDIAENRLCPAMTA